jgi:YgiT-type zinc finger domain-containing protein
MKRTAKPKKIKRNPAFKECAYCGAKKARPVLLNHAFGTGAKMIVVENVLTIVCDNCSQSYFTGDTLEKLDEILAAPQDYVVQTVINVADLSLV